MRVLKAMIAGALALGGLLFAQADASARPMTPPALTNVVTTDVSGVTTESAAAPCQYYRGYRRGYGWRRHYYRPYGYRRYGYYRRPYGFYHRPWRRHYGWRRW